MNSIFRKGVLSHTRLLLITGWMLTSKRRFEFNIRRWFYGIPHDFTNYLTSNLVQLVALRRTEPFHTGLYVEFEFVEANHLLLHKVIDKATCHFLDQSVANGLSVRNVHRVVRREIVDVSVVKRRQMMGNNTNRSRVLPGLLRNQVVNVFRNQIIVKWLTWNKTNNKVTGILWFCLRLGGSCFNRLAGYL